MARRDNGRGDRRIAEQSSADDLPKESEVRETAESAASPERSRTSSKVGTNTSELRRGPSGNGGRKIAQQSSGDPLPVSSIRKMVVRFPDHVPAFRWPGTAGTWLGGGRTFSEVGSATSQIRPKDRQNTGNGDRKIAEQFFVDALREDSARGAVARGKSTEGGQTFSEVGISTSQGLPQPRSENVSSSNGRTVEQFPDHVAPAVRGAGTSRKSSDGGRSSSKIGPNSPPLHPGRRRNDTGNIAKPFSDDEGSGRRRKTSPDGGRTSSTVKSTTSPLRSTSPETQPTPAKTPQTADGEPRAGTLNPSGREPLAVLASGGAGHDERSAAAMAMLGGYADWMVGLISAVAVAVFIFLAILSFLAVVSCRCVSAR